MNAPLVSSFLVATVLLAGPAAGSRRVDVFDGRAELVVPSRWREVPPQELDFLALRAAEATAGRVVPEARHAYVSSPRGLRGGPPFLLVQWRGSGRIPFGRLVDHPDPSRVPARDHPDLGLRLETTRISFDRDRMALETSGTLPDSPWGPLVARTHTRLTEIGTVTLLGYSRSREAELNRPLWREIFDGLRVRAPLTYQPRLTDWWPWLRRRPSTWYLLAAVTALATAAAAVTGALRRRL